MSLVDVLPTTEKKNSNWVPFRTVTSEVEARIIQGRLETEGIPCTIESLKYHMEPVNFGTLSEVRLHVLKDDLPRANDLLDAADRGEYR
ncbi:MAG: putative signal transducing protein [Acidobacteriota bacterium]